MRRVISQTAFVLKGSGWYVTDYPSEARRKGMEGEKPKSPSPAKDAASGKKGETASGKKAPASSKDPAAKKQPKK